VNRRFRNLTLMIGTGRKMASSILVPQVGQDLTVGKIVALHVKVGDRVAKGDVVAEVESEKATFEVEAFDSGTVTNILYKVGDTAEVLKPLLFLGEPGEAAASPAPRASALESAHAVKMDGGSLSDRDVSRPSNVMRSSPLARRLAARHGLDILRLAGTGPNGSVVKRDIEAALAKDPAAIQGRATKSTAGSPIEYTSASIAFRTLQNGSGDPIIFLHGFGAELGAWRPFVGHVGVPNTIIAFDLPAHGQSADLPAGDFDELVDRAATALGEAGFGPFHLVGHSLGAAVGAALAGSGGLDVRSLTLLAPAGLGPKINGDFIAGFLAATSERALKAWMRTLVFDPANLSDTMVRQTLAFRAHGAAVMKQSRLAAALFADGTQLFTIRDALERFQGATRVIVGLNDMIIPSEHAGNLPGHIALHKLPRVGHLPQLEATKLVARLVTETVRSAG
jgi:pimeloyl-ACP methyl ester carboxylesterase